MLQNYRWPNYKEANSDWGCHLEIHQTRRREKKEGVGEMKSRERPVAMLAQY